jgi:hypothetical protein
MLLILDVDYEVVRSGMVSVVRPPVAADSFSYSVQPSNAAIEK